MLFKVPSNTLPPTSKSNSRSNPVVTAKSLAHRKTHVSQRALLVAGVLAGEVDFKPTIGQLARMARVSVSSVRAAREIVHDPIVCRNVLNGSCSLLTAAAKHKNGNGNGNGTGTGRRRRRR